MQYLCETTQIVTQQQTISSVWPILYHYIDPATKTMWILNDNPCELCYQNSYAEKFISFTFVALLIS